MPEAACGIAAPASATFPTQKHWIDGSVQDGLTRHSLCSKTSQLATLALSSHELPFLRM